MSTLSLRPRQSESPDDIRCPSCRKLIWQADERVLLSRITRFPAGTPAEACCKICKTWVTVPIVVAPPPAA